MPNATLTLKQILRRVTLTIYFMKVWIISFVVYQGTKWLSAILTLSNFKNLELDSLIIWSIGFGIFNLLQIPLWIYFWSMSYRFLKWLELDLEYKTHKKCALSCFFMLQICQNISGGIID